VPDALKSVIDEFNVAASKQTTHPNRRSTRQRVLVEAVGKI
jgi:hypothetical protein